MARSFQIVSFAEYFAAASLHLEVEAWSARSTKPRTFCIRRLIHLSLVNGWMSGVNGTPLTRRLTNVNGFDYFFPKPLQPFWLPIKIPSSNRLWTNRMFVIWFKCVPITEIIVISHSLLHITLLCTIWKECTAIRRRRCLSADRITNKIKPIDTIIVYHPPNRCRDAQNIFIMYLRFGLRPKCYCAWVCGMRQP